MTLPDKLRALASFDYVAWDDAIKSCAPRADELMVMQKHAAKDENARLTPLIEALVRVAGSVADWRDAWASQDTSDAGPARRRMFDSLAELERLVEGEK